MKGVDGFRRALFYFQTRRLRDLRVERAAPNVSGNANSSFAL